MIEKYNLQGRVCHISTKEAAEKVVAAKARGIKVTAEIAPHHLYFDEEVIASAAEAILSREKIASSDVIKISQREALLALTKMFQVNPPIRQTKENRLALIAALKNGEIDYLATDHAPHTIEEKEKGMSGLTHLDTYGSFATWLMKEHGFTAQDIIRICSYNPANFLSSFTDKKYGKIAEGFVGCLTVIDTGHSSVVDKTKLKTKARWSPFEGVTFPGAPIYTIIKGKLNKTLW
jgi:dihydroorotase